MESIWRDWGHLTHLQRMESSMSSSTLRESSIGYQLVLNHQKELHGSWQRYFIHVSLILISGTFSNSLIYQAGLMPPTPIQLHKSGLVDLSDRSTWDVIVGDKDGKELTRLSADDFKESIYGKPKEFATKDEMKLSHKDIKLDGSSTPTAPLSKNDALYVLKTYLGVN